MLLEIRTALWLRPALYCLVAVLVASSIAIADTWISPALLSWMPEIDKATVVDLLRLLAGGMLTVATVTLSVLMLVLSLAAGQASPRAVPELMADPVTQSALGTFLATFVFALTALLLFGVEAIVGPGIALTLLAALFYVIGALRYLVQWIHHVADTLKLNKVIARIHRQAEVALDDYLNQGDRKRNEDEPGAEASGIEICPRHSGYIQLIDVATLNQLAKAHELRVRMAVTEGDFVHPALPMMFVAGEAEDGDLQSELRGVVVIGAERSPEKDPLLGIELLAEIASRALSPGVNDPQSALICIDYLGSLLARAAAVPPDAYPPTLHKGGRVRLVQPKFERLLIRAFRPLMREGAANAEVICAIEKRLNEIASVAAPTYLEPIAEEGRRALDFGLARLFLDADKESLKAIAKRLQDRCSSVPS